MTEIKFPYEPWTNRDLLLRRASTTFAFGLLQSGVEVSHPPTVKQGRGTASGLAVDGVIGVLASAIEWLRQYGVSPEEVQARFNRLVAANKADNPVRLKAERANKISDPRNEAKLLNPKQVLP